MRRRLDASAAALPIRPNAPAPLGYAALLLALFTLVNGLRAWEDLWIPAISSAIFALFGWGLMHGDARLAYVVRSKDRALLVPRHGLRLQRQIALTRRPSLKVTGGDIPSFEMNARQEEPEHRLRVGRHKVPVDCDQTQGAWLVNGLPQWARGASDARS